MEISTLNRTSAFLLILMLFSGLVAGSHYYSHQQSGYSVTGDTGFSVPEYESQSELATELVAPFLFIVVLMKFAFQKVLIFSFAEDDRVDWPGRDDHKSLYSREATLMAVAVTGMMIPTPFWGYVRLIASSLGFIATSAVALVILFLIYSFIRG
ncbi:MAG: hypothetical protein ACI8Z7_000048 [Candidatus Nanohaloarchaea archaeon]|jgi:hypothetical protein